MALSMVAMGAAGFAGTAVADGSEVGEIEVDTAENLIAAAAGDEVDGEVVEEDGTITVTEDIEVTDADDGDPNVQILVDGVTLTGETDDVEISGLDADDEISSGTGGFIKVGEEGEESVTDGVTISDLTLTFEDDPDSGTGDPVIRILDPGVTVDNVDATKRSHGGNFDQVVNIEEDGNGAVIENSVLQSGGELALDGQGGDSGETGVGANAIITDQVGDATIDDNTLRAEAFQDDGIHVFGGSDTEIVNTDFEDGDQLGEDGAYVTGVDEEDLDDILENNDNTFDPDAVVVDDSIVVEPAEGEVLNLDTGERFDSGTAIQDAINEADGDHTLLVGPGTYEESIIDVKGLTLESVEDADTTEIVLDEEGSAATVTVDADGVTVDGFTVTRQNGEAFSQGISVDDSDNVVIENNILNEEGDNSGDDINTQAILVTTEDSSSDDVTVEDNNVSDFGEGVALSTQSDNPIADVTVEDNTFSGVGIGVKVSNTDDSETSIDGTIENNDITDNEFGVYVIGTDEDARIDGGLDYEPVNVDDLSLTDNNIESNDEGVVNNGANELTATSNWWGEATGPSDEGSGDGDSVSENVDFAPWLVEAGGDDIDPSLEIFLTDDSDDNQFNSVDQVEIGIDAVGAGTDDGFVEAFDFNLILEDDDETVETFTVDDIDDIVEGLNLGEEVDELDDGDYTLTIEPTESVYDGLDAFDDDVLEDDVSFGIEEPTETTGTGTTGTSSADPATSETQTTTVSDARSGEAGVTVTTGQSSVSAITFSDEDASGTVSVAEFDDVPADSPQLDADRPTFGVTEVTVPDDQRDQSATLEFTVDADALEDADTDADDVVVLRAPEDAEEFETLDTSAETNGDTVTVTAETPGFSLFVVSSADEVEADDDADADEDDEPDAEPTDDESDEADETEDGIPGFGVVVALVSLIATALLVTRRRRNG